MTCPRCGRPAVGIPRIDHAGRVVDREWWFCVCTGEPRIFRAQAEQAPPAAVQGRLPGFEGEGETEAAG